MRIRRHSLPWSIVAVLGLLLLLPVGALLAEPVNVFKLYKLPRGLAWGQSDADVRGILDRERASITNKDGDTAAEVWEIKGLFINNLESASFTFIDKKLEGIELRYGNPKWSERKAQGVFGDFQISAEHAIGNASDRHRETSTQAGVKETTEAMEWRVDDEVVRLVYFSAIKGKEAFQLVSVHLTRKQGEDAMKAIANAGVTPEMKDPPGAGGPGETLFLVEPELPGDPAAEAAAAAAMKEQPLPGDLFSEENLQAGGDGKEKGNEVDALALAAEAAAATDKEANAAALPPADTVQEQSGAAQAAVQALTEMSAVPNPPVPPAAEAPQPGPDAAQKAIEEAPKEDPAPPKPIPQAENTEPEKDKTAATP